MDEQEAQELLDQEINQLRLEEYDRLTGLLKSPLTCEIEAASGTRYQIEVQAFWDHPRQPNANLRVIVSIDDGSFLASLSPMTSDFIMTPDGRYIGE